MLCALQSLARLSLTLPAPLPAAHIPTPSPPGGTCPTPSFAFGLSSPLLVPGLSSPGPLGCLPSPGGLALGKWQQDIDPEVWFEDAGEQQGSIQELFPDAAAAGSIFVSDAAAAAAAAPPAPPRPAPVPVGGAPGGAW
jgi:hypothetical protein